MKSPLHYNQSRTDRQTDKYDNTTNLVIQNIFNAVEVIKSICIAEISFLYCYPYTKVTICLSVHHTHTHTYTH